MLDLLHRHPWSAGRPGSVLWRPSLPRSSAPSPPARRRAERLNLPYGDAQQLVVVTAPIWSSPAARSPRTRSRRPLADRPGCPPGPPGPQWLQRRHHHEGDGTTPAGSFLLTGIMGRQPTPASATPTSSSYPATAGSADAASPSYRPARQRQPACAKPQRGHVRHRHRAVPLPGHRRLQRRPRRSWARSAIFLHRHQYDSAGRTVPTSGCVSLSETDLLAVLRWLDPSLHPRILMGPDSWLITPPST